MKEKTLPAVLVVEDETLIRMDAVFMIEDAGFRTYDASSADVALTLIQDQDDIGIVFTDIDMPGSMNGLQLADRVREGWPEIVVVVTSGMLGLDDIVFPPGVLCLPKPYATSHLIKILHEISRQRER